MESSGRNRIKFSVVMILLVEGYEGAESDSSLSRNDEKRPMNRSQVDHERIVKGVNLTHLSYVWTYICFKPIMDRLVGAHEKS